MALIVFEHGNHFKHNSWVITAVSIHHGENPQVSDVLFNQSSSVPLFPCSRFRRGDFRLWLLLASLFLRLTGHRLYNLRHNETSTKRNQAGNSVTSCNENFTTKYAWNCIDNFH